MKGSHYQVSFTWNFKVVPQRKLTRLERIQEKARARMSSQAWRKQGLFGPPMVIKQNVSLNPHKFREDIKLLKKLGENITNTKTE